MNYMPKILNEVDELFSLRFVSVVDEQDRVEYQIVGRFELPRTYCIENGMICMPDPLNPLESTKSDQRTRIRDKL